jgi:hypothetical protein
MSKVYSVLKSLPATIGAVVTFGSGLFLGALTDEMKTRQFGPLLNYDAVMKAAIALLILTNIYTLALWLLKPTTVEAPKPAPHDTKKLTSGLHDAMTGGGASRANMPLNGVLVRVYKILGGAPDKETDPDAFVDFIRRVDFELADKVHLNRMSVWGRHGGAPLALIRDTSRIRFHHYQKSLVIPTDAIRFMDFTDLVFNKEEVDQVWPDPQGRAR